MQSIQKLRASIPKETKRFIKFLFVGSFGFAVDFGTFNLFHKLGVGVWIAAHFFPAIQAYFVDYPKVIEQACSFVLAVSSNFTWNYFWIYPEARGSDPARKMLKFFIVSVASLLIGTPVYIIALYFIKPIVTGLGLDGLLPIDLAANLALICRVAALLFWNFFVNRKWTYGEIPVNKQ